MKTVSPRVENERVHVTTRPAIRSRGDAVARAVSTARQRLVLERWIVDLLVLALAPCLVGATALYGLAAASRWVPPASPPIADRLNSGDEESGTGSLNVGRDLVRSQDMQ
jgi:hypothetical protein